MRLTLWLVSLGIYSAQLTAQTDCVNPDVDCDGFVTVNDILGLLSYFGDADIDGDGIWDSQDDCIPDECGVCNGPGPIYEVIVDIEVIYDSVFAEQIDDWIVFEVGADTTFMYTCAPVFQSCGDQFGYQGYDYATVLIGEQCWFAENLRSELYANGDSIPSAVPPNEWGGTGDAVAVYGEYNTFCWSETSAPNACEDSDWSLDEFGRLYNGYAVNDARALCPSGWHVPTDDEWTVLTDFLGGWVVAGGHLKAQYGCINNTSTNSSGFSGLPGGYRSFNGYFDLAGSLGYWWTASPNGSDDYWYRKMDCGSNQVTRSFFSPDFGMSIRCIKDAE